MNNAVDIYMDMSAERSAMLEETSGVFTDPYILLTMSRVTKKDFQGAMHTVAVAYNQGYDGIDVDLAENVRAILYAMRRVNPENPYVMAHAARIRDLDR